MDNKISVTPACPPIDLRSDTVTKPTGAMYERMMTADIGDDGLDGDPTARELEAVAAALLGKEAALFTASCTMANLLATFAHVGRSEQILLEAESHMYTTERGGATISGAFYAPIAGQDGAMRIELLEESLGRARSRLKTGMIAMETSHNNAGGAVLPLAHMAAVATAGRDRAIAVHLDGARLFNAAVHLNVSPADIASYCDTVAVCLSKGLSAPMGAIVAGDRDVVDRMRSFRKLLGGQQRQVGIIAAAGLEAITTMGKRLAEDHARAQMLSTLLARADLPIGVSYPQTNIVQVDVSSSGRSPDGWVDALAAQGVLVRPWTNGRLRCVTHRHIGDDDIVHAVQCFQQVGKATPALEGRS